MSTFYDTMFNDAEANAWWRKIGDEKASRVDTDGSMGKTNEAWEDGTSPVFQVESQRLAAQVFLGGIAAGKAEWIDKGLRGVEWGLTPEVMGPSLDWIGGERNSDASSDPDGLVILGHAMHPRSMALEEFARVAWCGKQADIAPEYEARAEALVAPLEQVAIAMVQSGDVEAFLACPNSSQLSYLATGLQLVGKMAKNDDLRTAGREVMQRIMDMQLPSGAAAEYYEPGSNRTIPGYDSIYGMQTLDLTTVYEATLVEGSAWYNTVHAFNQRLMGWEVSRVASDGSIDCTGNSRQGPDGAPLNTADPHGWDIDSTALRLMQAATVMGTLDETRPVIDAVQFRGQEYDHFLDIAASHI